MLYFSYPKERITKTMNLEIRTNGQIDYKRMIGYKAKALGNKIDRFFVEGHWPKEDTA